MKRTVSLIMAACLLIALFGCGVQAGEAKAAPVQAGTAAPIQPVRPTPVPTSTPAPTPAVTETPEATKAPDVTEAPDLTEEYVSPAFYEDGTYLDAMKNKYDFVFSIPSVMLDSDEIAALNTNIYDLLYPYIEDTHSLMDGKLSLTVTGIDYDAYLNGNVLSVVSAVKYDYDFVEYHVWNVDIDSKSLVSAEELFSMTELGSDGSGLYDICAGAVGKYYAEKFPLDQKFWREQYDLTIAEENISAAQFFFNADNEFTAIVTLHVPVGGGSISSFIPMIK